MKNKLTGPGPNSVGIEQQLQNTIKSLLESGIDDREIVFGLSEAIVRLAEASKEKESVFWPGVAARYLDEESRALAAAARDPMTPLGDTVIKPGQA